MRAACEDLTFYKEYEGKRYCVLYYPSKEKEADFKIALQKKLKAKDFNFHGMWVPSLTDSLALSLVDALYIQNRQLIKEKIGEKRKHICYATTTSMNLSYNTHSDQT
jgi:hypothetical protein